MKDNIDSDFEIIKDKYGWVLINHSKKRRLSQECKDLDEYKIRIIWKKCHTHLKNFRMALIMKENLIKRKLPKTKTKRLLKSYIRVSDNNEFIKKISDILANINKNLRSDMTALRQDMQKDEYFYKEEIKENKNKRNKK